MVHLCEQEIWSHIYILYISVHVVGLVWIAMLVKVEMHMYHVTCVFKINSRNPSDADWPGAIKYSSE